MRKNNKSKQWWQQQKTRNVVRLGWEWTYKGVLESKGVVEVWVNINNVDVDWELISEGFALNSWHELFQIFVIY